MSVCHNCAVTIETYEGGQWSKLTNNKAKNNRNYKKHITDYFLDALASLELTQVGGPVGRLVIVSNSGQ